MIQQLMVELFKLLSQSRLPGPSMFEGQQGLELLFRGAAKLFGVLHEVLVVTILLFLTKLLYVAIGKHHYRLHSVLDLWVCVYVCAV